MDESSMEMTEAVHNSQNILNKIESLDSTEAIFQENYELKKKLELAEKLNRDVENELSFVTSAHKADISKLSSCQTDCSEANLKIKQLENLLDEERQQVNKLNKEILEYNSKPVKVETVIVSDQEEVNILTGKLLQLQALRDEDQIKQQKILEEKEECSRTIAYQKAEIKEIKTELSEIKELLRQKIQDNRFLNENLESLREDKLLLNTELEMLKASTNKSSRGNSLFAEVEENRQKAVGQRELLKTKYFNLKKMLGQKQAEINKLKMEIVQIRREEKEDEKTIHQDYSVLVQTVKERNTELESEIKTLKQKLGNGPIIMSDGDIQNFQLVNSIIEGVRNEVASLQQELDRRGSNYVHQGHQLFESQKENRRLKAINKKCLSDIDELKFKLDTIQSSAKESMEDGVSPPATEASLVQQRQKVVKFQEAVSVQIS